MDIQDIETIVDFDAAKAKNWINEFDTDLKRRKEAEFLISEDIPTAAILGFVVFNENVKSNLMKLNINEKRIVIKKNYYF